MLLGLPLRLPEKRYSVLLTIENPRFRLLWAGGGLAGLGALAFMTVHGWLTLTLTDSPFWVGAAMGAGGLGMMSFVGLGGVLADRLPRRRLVVVSGVSRAAAVALLAIPVAAESVQLWHIMTTALLFGAAEAIRAPAYMALIVDLVGRQRVMAANAANFAALGIAGVVAPLVGASIITAWGLEWAYLFVAGTELAAAIMMVRIEVPPAAATTLPGAPSSEAPPTSSAPPASARSSSWGWWESPSAGRTSPCCPSWRGTCSEQGWSGSATFSRPASPACSSRRWPYQAAGTSNTRGASL